MRRTSLLLPFVIALVLCGSLAAAQRRSPRLAALFRGGDAPVQLGPTPPGLTSTEAEACGGCHAEIAAEWRGSQHATAWTDEVFQAAYALEPMAFCRNCHAPLTRPGARHPDAVAQREGVSCAVCHVRAGSVLGAGRGDASARRAPHPVMAVRALGESAFCAGCHQFNFPGDPGPGREPFASDEPMQDTFEEWAISQAAREGTQCQDCHMPWRTTPSGVRYRSHAFPGGSDRQLLERAVRVTVEARRHAGAVVVSATVAAGETGHSFPTGDLFRRAELRVWIEGEESGAQTVAFARESADVLERGPRGEMLFLRRQRSDSRVPPPGPGTPRTHTLQFEAPHEVRVRWALDYLLMPTPIAASNGVGVARNRTRVLEGEVAVATAEEGPR